MTYTDIGANLCSPRFAKDLPEVIARAKQVGITRILVTASDVEESEQAVLLCRQYPELLFATAGVHPHCAGKVASDFTQQLGHYLNQREVRSVGEMGLDYNRNYSSVQDQESVFEAQLELAARVSLPVFLHERDAAQRFQEIFRNWCTYITGGVLHCFTGTDKDLKVYLDLGLYLGITGWICDPKRGLRLQKLVEYIPDDRLLIETDAPYLAPKTLDPVPNRNEPALLPEVAKMIAKCRKQSPLEVMAMSHANAERLFGFEENGHSSS